MKISLVDVDGHNFPNLALMKLSAWHKLCGDEVDWYEPLFSKPDKIYASKVFTFTEDFDLFSPDDPEPIKGGTGYNASVKLEDEIERTLPDYSIYPKWNTAVGFLSRGCIRSCPWCVVPRKEGELHVVDDIERIAGNRRCVTLLDNNFLACPESFIEETLLKAKRLNLRLDFNQALDARLVTEKTAYLLASTKWIKYIRFACDTSSMLPFVERAVKLCRKFGYNGEFFFYVLAKDVEEAHERILKLTKIDYKITPFCMPYREFTKDYEVTGGVKHLARWCNIQSIRKTVTFSEYCKTKHFNL